MILLNVFTASWCSPCKAMKPALEELAAEGVSIQMIDIDTHPEIAAINGIRSVPTTKVYKDKELVATKTGAMSLSALRELVSV